MYAAEKKTFAGRDSTTVRLISLGFFTLISSCGFSVSQSDFVFFVNRIFRVASLYRALKWVYH